MERVRKQDEERKRRKKEEKLRKEQEKELKRKMDEERLQREEEERERLEEINLKANAQEERLRRDKEENELRKGNFERSIRKVWNGSDIPCLFDQKIAYSKLLYTLPVALEQSIAANEVPKDDITFRRYKMMVLPVDSLFSKTSGLPLIELVQYFLRFSTMPIVDNTSKQQPKTFPFKCIGLTQTVAVPPFNKCSLSPVQAPLESPSSQRVLALLFDTHDQPRAKVNFNEALKTVLLGEILSKQSLSELAEVFPAYLEKMATDYHQANKLKEFPYPVNTKSSPLLTFENEADLHFSGEDEPLSRVSFFMEYTLQDDQFPITSKESWEFIRRYPTFYAYNPNSRTYSRIDSRDKVQTKYNQFKPENVCVIFKDLTLG